MNFKIQPLDIQTDLKEISSWDTKFANDPRYESIQKFILENNTFYGLGEVINTNYEILPIGKNERKYALSIKNQNNTIMGFVLALVHELETPTPELIIQYIVLNPDYQNHGLGNKVLSKLINHPEKYFNTHISSVFARIDNTNTASIKTFKKLGFNFNQNSTDYTSAELNILENYNE